MVDHDPARAALVTEGLAGVEPLDVRRVAVFDEAEATAFAPDVIVIASDSPDRDTLESLRVASVANPRPVVMFVDRSEPGLAEEAVRTGVAAYVVDGLAAARVRGVLEVAVSRFQLMHQLRQDLDKAKADLAMDRLVARSVVGRRGSGSVGVGLILEELGDPLVLVRRA